MTVPAPVGVEAGATDPTTVAARSPLAIVRRVAHLAWSLVISVVRDFILAVFQEGRIRTKGLPTGIRVALAAAVGVALALFVSIVAASAWRTVDPVVLTGGQTLRGTLVPAPLVPVTFAIVALAAALCVSGAVRAGLAVRVGVGVTYALVATFVHGFTVGSDGLHAVAGWAIVLVLVLLAIGPRLPPHPVVELLAALVLVGFTFADAHRLLVASDRSSGADFLVSQTSVLLADVLFLSGPLLVVAALAVVDFGVTAARWGVGFVERELSARWVIGAAVLLGAWRASDLVREAIDLVAADGVAAELRQLAGTAVLLGVLLLVSALVRRTSGEQLAHEDPGHLTEASGRVALPVALGLTVVSVFVAALFLLMQAASPILPFGTSQQLQEWVLDVIPSAATFGASTAWIGVRGAAALLGAWALARRHHPAAAFFLGAIGSVLLVGVVADPGRVLHDWSWTLHGVDVVAVAVLLVAMFRWWRRGELTERRAAWSLYLLLLTGLLRQGSFVSDPLAPFLAFAGAAFVLFGLVWNFATGLSWANESSPKLPRASRAQLLLGYQVLSIAILHWYLISHDVASLENLTTLQPDTGTALLGQPLVLVLILTALGAAFADLVLAPTDE